MTRRPEPAERERRQLELRCAAASIANAAATIEAAAAAIIRHVCAHTTWSYGRAYVRLEAGERSGSHWLALTAGDAHPPPDWEGEQLTPVGPPSDGLAAEALRRRRAALATPGDRRLPEASGAGCAVPLIHDGEELGSLEFYGARADEAAGPEELATVADQLAQVVVRVRAQRSALRQQQALGQIGRLASMRELARNLAHEVNQPLAAVVGYAGGALQLLEQGRMDEQKLRRALEQVGTQAKRASSIIQEFREFLRREGPRHDRVDVTRLVREAVSLAQGKARETGVTIILELPGHRAEVVGDAIQLQQVLINLIDNAIEAMADAGVTDRQLCLSVVDGEPLEIAIRDTGVGMSDEVLGELFTPFLTNKPHGLGMGLPVSRSIVEFHGGRLSGERNPDAGMTFRVRLPRV